MRKKKIKKCKYCKKDFEFMCAGSECEDRIFCSRVCANKSNRKKNSKSKLGEKNPMFKKRPWNYKKYGVQKGKKGKDSHFWKGGISDESKLARASGKWKKWRLAVYKRDNYICQICKEKGGKLVPHHIKIFRLYKDDRYKVENGVTLCSHCHRGLHNKNVNKRIINIYE